jgi:hypothetical protein
MLHPVINYTSALPAGPALDQQAARQNAGSQTSG